MSSWKKLRIPFLILIFAAVVAILVKIMLGPEPKKEKPAPRDNIPENVN